MFDIKIYLSQLENIKKPESLTESSVFLDQAVPLRIKESGFLDSPFVTARVLFKNSKAPKKTYSKNIWDADIKSSGPGYFDHNGNFVLDKPKRVVINWLVKKNNTIEGFFTEKEFSEFLNNVSPSGYWVKRDSDKGFVELEKLINDIPNFMNSKDLNKYFSQNQKIEEVKKEEDSFFDTPIFVEKSSRLTNFLRNHEIGASLDFIIKKITGLKKSEAIDTLIGVLGLDKEVVTALVDLIVENAGYQILSDVDKDGFYLGNGTRRERRK